MAKIYKLFFYFLIIFNLNAFAVESEKPPVASAPIEKAFFIMPAIELDAKLTWQDVGVSKRELFTGAIYSSWKGLLREQFKDYPVSDVVEMLPVGTSEEVQTAVHGESVVLKWKSTIKRTFISQDKTVLRFEVLAQFILAQQKNGQVIYAFDFPLHKKEFKTASDREVSSGLASLIFNLLNSQTQKIKVALEQNRVALAQNEMLLRVRGAHGMSDLIGFSKILRELYPEAGFSLEIKTYSREESTIKLRSRFFADEVYKLFLKNEGKINFNEQKILQFLENEHAFAILPKPDNN